MKEFIMKYKIQIAAAVLAIAAVLVIAVKLSGKGGGSERIAYVDTVESLTGQNASLGMVNRFSGVVEPQGLWSLRLFGCMMLRDKRREANGLPCFIIWS